MAVAIDVTPASPVSILDACVIAVSGGSANDSAVYEDDGTVYPASPELKSYLRFVKGGVEYGRSYVFTVSADGDHEFPNYVFPSAGAWTVTLCRADTDAVLATESVTVS